jgi:hypothetical protein
VRFLARAVHPFPSCRFQFRPSSAFYQQLMGVTEEAPNVIGKVVGWFLDKRGALTVTKSHLGQMREVVETALQTKRWPPGAPAERWESSWSRNGPMLSRRLKSTTFDALEQVYGLADDFKRGLGPGERDFDATVQHAGDDQAFFLRFIQAIDKADATIGPTRM